MSENTEAQILQRLNVLIGVVTPLGAAYAPPDAFAATAHLTAQAAAGQAAIDALDAAEAAEALARNQRQAVFAPAAALGSDVYRLCRAMNWAETDLADLQSNVRELRGGRAVPKPKDNPATLDVDESQTGGSASQKSYASMEANWSEIIAFLNEKGYATTASGMGISDLQNVGDQMRAANLDVASTEGATANARQQRDEVFYTAPGSIVASAQSAKNYLRAVHEDTQAWAAVKDLRFPTPRRLRT